MFGCLISKINSIKYKYLTATFIFMISFAVVIIYFWYTSTAKDAETEAVKYITNVLKASNDSLEISMKDINYILTSASFNNNDILAALRKGDNIPDPEKYNDISNIELILSRISSNKFYLNGITLTDFEKKYYQAGVTMPLEDLKKQPWVSRVIKSKGENIFIPPHYYDNWAKHYPENSYKDMVFSFAKSIRAENANVGYIIADIRCEMLYDLFNKRLEDKGSVYVIDNKNGEPIFYSGSSDGTQVLNGPDGLLALLKNHKNAEKNTFIKLNGEDVLLVSYYSSFTDWTTYGLIPKSKLLSNFYEARQYILLLTLIFCIPGAVVLYIISSLVTNRILKLCKAVKLIGNGNFDLSIKIESKDELGQLFGDVKSMASKIKLLIEDISKTEKEKRKAEMIALQSQINPHFLHNTINTIKFLSTLHGVDNITRVSEALSTLMHINMDKRVFISVEEEISYIKSYLYIQEYKYSKLVYNISVEEGVEGLMTLKLLLQPVVENSILHGITLSEYNAVINIKVYRDDNLLKMRVQDNGTGIPEDVIDGILEGSEASKGIGLRNVNSRLKLYFGQDYGVSITSRQNLFTVVELVLPTITESEAANYA